MIIRMKQVEGPWEHSSKVIHGHGVAREADWRTANLTECPQSARERGFYSCMTNYGKASLIRSEHGTCEVHIHDFNGDIYGKEIKLKDLKQREIPFGLK
jgi:FAD synthase